MIFYLIINLAEKFDSSDFISVGQITRKDFSIFLSMNNNIKIVSKETKTKSEKIIK